MPASSPCFPQLIPHYMFFLFPTYLHKGSPSHTQLPIFTFGGRQGLQYERNNGKQFLSVSF